MVHLSQVESDLTSALKARDTVTVSVLRALKTRIQNEHITRMKELSESELFSLVQSEIKRRKEAAESFVAGGRSDLAEQELRESDVLVKYLPPQVSESEIASFVENLIAEHSLTTADFGKGMGLLKAHFGNSAEGAVLSKILKEKLKS